MVEHLLMTMVSVWDGMDANPLGLSRQRGTRRRHVKNHKPFLLSYDRPCSIVRLSAIFFVCGLFSVFSTTATAQPTAPRLNHKRVIVCSTTQTADFARQIVGEDWEVVSVLGPGHDPHTYEVGNDDLISVKRADLCVHNGWNLEGQDWMRVLAESAGKPVVTCTDHVSPLLISEEGAERLVRDPHAWFDTNCAAIYVQNILNGVQTIDPDNADRYQARADEYLLQLRDLDCWIRAQVNAIPLNRRILITHHDAFRYFCHAYGFQSLSPMSWTTGELTDVTLQQRQSIVGQIRSLGVKSLFVESTINRELLDGIARDAGVNIGGELYSDAMGSSGSGADTYMGMMKHNVEMIVRHLK